MAHAGEVIEHPVFRHRATFIRTAADTNGEVLELQFVIGPGGPQLLPHIHRLQLEQFEMLDGSIRFSIAGRRIDRARGERVEVPRGTSHSFHNVTSAPASFRVMYRPALRLEDYFTALYVLGASGKVNRQGLPNPLWLAVLMSEFPKEFFYLPLIPWRLQRALAAPLTLMGLLLGYSSAKLT